MWAFFLDSAFRVWIDWAGKLRSHLVVVITLQQIHYLLVKNISGNVSCSSIDCEVEFHEIQKLMVFLISSLELAVV